jgi:hypothetical protein
MKQSRTISLITGSLIIVLGFVLLAGVAGLLENITVYMWVLPLLFILSGFISLWGAPKAKTTVGYGLIATGLIALLVRLGWIDAALVNALLAGALIATGSIMITRTQEKTDTKQ